MGAAFWVLFVIWLVAFIVLLVLALLLCANLYKKKDAGKLPEMEDEDEPEDIDVPEQIREYRSASLKNFWLIN